jgi:uncharacterized membrane-anchored protein YitT (DUF2179 family)
MKTFLEIINFTIRENRQDYPMKTSNLRKSITSDRAATEARRIILIVIGAILAAFGYAVFQVPYNLAAGGVGGVSLIINNFTGWPVGTLYFVLNLPLLVLGYRQLGRWSFVARTLLGVTVFAIFTDLFVVLMPNILNPFPPTDDILLSAIYGGLLGGIGGGLVYRAHASIGGTGIVGRVIQQKTGLPLSQSYIYTDGAILLLMGLVFGWQVSLYGFLILLINGLASDYILEGASITRVVTIVSNRPQDISTALIETLGRGVSFWEVTGAYTGRNHYMLSCTVYRSQVNELRRVIAEVDPEAFVTIGVGHQALGQGFLPLLKRSGSQ